MATVGGTIKSNTTNIIVHECQEINVCIFYTSEVRVLSNSKDLQTLEKLKYNGSVLLNIIILCFDTHSGPNAPDLWEKFTVVLEKRFGPKHHVD